MSAPTASLLEWVRKRRVDLTESGLITRIELWHSVDGEGAERLESVLIEDRDESEDVDELTIELWNAAEEDAATRAQGSVQRYILQVFRGDSHDPEESRAFLLKGSVTSSIIGGNTEPPTPRGLLSQEMRERNDLHGLLFRMAEGVSGGMARQLETERAYNTLLQNQRREYLEQEQKALDRSHERQLERERQQKSDERLDSLLGVLTTVGPLLLGKFLESKSPKLSNPPGSSPGWSSPGGSDPSGGSTPPVPPDTPPIPPGFVPAMAMGLPPLDVVRGALSRDVAVAQLLGTLEAAQFQRIAEVLRPDQALGFMELYGAYKEAVEARIQETRIQETRIQETRIQEKSAEVNHPAAAPPHPSETPSRRRTPHPSYAQQDSSHGKETH